MDAGHLVLVLLLQHLPEPGFLLVLGENQARVHPYPEASLVAALLAFLPVLLGHVALAVLLARVHLANRLKNKTFASRREKKPIKKTNNTLFGAVLKNALAFFIPLSVIALA